MWTAFPLSFLAPAVLVGAAGLAATRPGRRPGRIPLLSEGAALIALALSAIGALQLLLEGPMEARMLFTGNLGLQLEPVGATMTLLVAFIGWVVMRYSRTYLDGEAREGLFHALMLATLASVLVFAQAGSFLTSVLALIAVGISLRRLLMFYPERTEARRAATKFSLVWHSGDAALVLAAGLIYAAFGTTQFSQLPTALMADLPLAAGIAVGLIVFGAALKTAAFPLHGWLTEAMEAPTPVSALLHAGIINAGGVLLIQTAGLVQAKPGAMAALVMLGGLTALFGATVMLTQSAIKTALAWSTVAQMGFMLMQIGLGLWALALLHIIAHSLYKAHAFLSSGGAVQAVAALRRPGPIAVPNMAAVAKSFALALLLYASVAAVFSLIAGPKSPQSLALGTMLVFGVAYLVAQGLADTAPAALTRRTGLAALGAAVAYFAFQMAAHAIWGPYLPPAPEIGPLEMSLLVLAVISFGVVAVAQTLFPLWSHHPATDGWRVHLANGLYLNALLDRLIGGFRTAKSN